MNAKTLFIGAGVMIALGIAFSAATGKAESYNSWIAVGLGLMWVGFAIK